MLVLTRKKGERVMIGDDIVVTVIDVRGDGVRIGFDAPRGISIQRAEVVNAVKEANTGAAASAAQTGDLLVGLLNRARKQDPSAAPAEPAQTPDAAAPPVPAAPQAAARQEPARRAERAPVQEQGDPAQPGGSPKPTPPRPRG